MATERMAMRKIREVLRLRWQLGLTVREAARSLGVSLGVVSKMGARATTAGLTWELVEGLDDAALEERLYGRPVALTAERARPDPVYLHTELRRALFVAVLGASNFTYAEATATQRVADFVASHERAFAYFDGVTEMVVPDQLKSGVVMACRYEPTIQRTYGDMARHYGTAIVPARPRKPRDKAKVEVGVQIAQRWILARLRREQHFSLVSLNARIRELLDDLNLRPMKTLGGVSRRELFERYDRPALRSLPAERFEYGE